MGTASKKYHSTPPHKWGWTRVLKMLEKPDMPQIWAKGRCTGSMWSTFPQSLYSGTIQLSSNDSCPSAPPFMPPSLGTCFACTLCFCIVYHMPKFCQWEDSLGAEHHVVAVNTRVRFPVFPLFFCKGGGAFWWVVPSIGLSFQVSNIFPFLHWNLLRFLKCRAEMEICPIQLVPPHPDSIPYLQCSGQCTLIAIPFPSDSYGIRAVRCCNGCNQHAMLTC